MATQFFIPQEVVQNIHDWVRKAELRTIADFPQTSADEDAVVESLGTRLRCQTRLVQVALGQEIPGLWRWSISHTRFGSKGRGAEEKIVGADVIVELDIRSSEQFRRDTKALLLQAKKQWSHDSRIFEQAAKLSTWREAAAVVNLTAAHIEAFGIDDVIAGRGRRPTQGAVAFSTFFANHFVAGSLGDETLAFDPRRRRLQWMDMHDTLVQCSFHCRHRFTVRVSPPGPQGPRHNAAMIQPEEIHKPSPQSNADADARTAVRLHSGPTRLGRSPVPKDLPPRHAFQIRLHSASFSGWCLPEAPPDHSTISRTLA